MPYTCLLHGAGEDILTVPTYYRLRAMTVDGNGRSGFTHIDIPLLQDGPTHALSAKQAGAVGDLGIIDSNRHAHNSNAMHRAQLALMRP